MSAAEHVDDLDIIHQALKGYDTLFGPELTGRELQKAWKSLADTRPEVVRHIDLRLRYLQVRATLELGQDLAALTELCEALLKTTRSHSGKLRDLLNAADDGVQLLQALDVAWNGAQTTELQDYPEVGEVIVSAHQSNHDGNVSTDEEEA